MLPKILEFSFNISATAKPSDFKFGMQLGFVIKSHQEKSRRGHELEKLPKILEFPFNDLATAIASDFKFAHSIYRVNVNTYVVDQPTQPWFSAFFA